MRPHLALRHRRGADLDAQTRGEESSALLALIAACIAQAALDYDDGRLGPSRVRQRADRGEPLARDPPRARRQADRLRAPARRSRPGGASSGCSSGRRRRAPSCARRTRASALLEAATAPSASGARTRPASDRGRSTARPWRRRSAPTSRRARPSRHGAMADERRTRAEPRRQPDGAAAEAGHARARRSCARGSRRSCASITVAGRAAPERRQPGQPRPAAPDRQGPDERDLEQARLGIEAVRALPPAARAGAGRSPVRDALSQLQIAYAREASARRASPAAEAAAGRGRRRRAAGRQPGGPERPVRRSGPRPARPTLGRPVCRRPSRLPRRFRCREPRAALACLPNDNGGLTLDRVLDRLRRRRRARLRRRRRRLRRR